MSGYLIMINALTRALYAAGWTREHHPDNVYWGDFENFSYKWEYLKETVWKTGCGLLVEGRTVSMSDVSYGGIWFCPENGNPIIRCPYSRRDCEQQTGALAKYCMCVCSRSDACYDYQNSAEKVEEELSKKSQAKYLELTGGQYCACVIGSNGFQPGEYQIDFSPDRCIQYGCKNEVCSVTKKRRDLSKVNIFYDIRREWITRAGLIEDHKTTIEKGVKVFGKPVARTDAELWLARKKASYNPFRSKTVIDPHLSGEDRQQEYFSKHHKSWPGYDYFEFQYSVENIRIEARETRDLLQDLKAVAEGIEVVHASDLKKEEEKAKHERKEKRSADKSNKLRKKHLIDFEKHWNDPLWKPTLQRLFGADYEQMIQKKEDQIAGINKQIDMFSEM